MIHDKIDLGCEYGAVFEMAFIFTPNGTKLLTGSRNNIRAYTSDWPACHAMIHQYRMSGIDKHWELFGRVGSLVLATTNPRGRLRFYGDRVSDGKRRKWVLFDRKQCKVLGSWRRLPSCYLKPLEQHNGVGAWEAEARNDRR